MILSVAGLAVDGWLYVFQVDSSGKIQWLFPRNDSSAFSCGANPVAPGQLAQIPAASTRNVLTLDRVTGCVLVAWCFDDFFLKHP